MGPRGAPEEAGGANLVEENSGSEHVIRDLTYCGIEHDSNETWYLRDSKVDRRRFATEVVGALPSN
jgi:hypothetical protein